MFCSITITGRRVGRFEFAPPLVRLELHAGRETISRAVSATYGFSEATGEVQMALAVDDGDAGDGAGELQPNTVTLALTHSDPPSQAVTAHLLDALTNRELARADGLDVTPTLFML
jgi:hypothetical protein